MSIKNVVISGCVIVFIFTISAFIYRHNTNKLNVDVEYPIKEKLEKIDIVKHPLKKNTKTDNTSPDDYFKVIVNNNIFRRLGWRPPKKEPEYTLIGTTTNPNSAYSEAIILERRSNQLRTVKVGETFGTVSVKEIKPKQVLLDDKGKEIKLKMGSQFLK